MKEIIKLIDERKSQCSYCHNQACHLYEGVSVTCDGNCDWVNNYAPLMELLSEDLDILEKDIEIDWNKCNPKDGVVTLTPEQFEGLLKKYTGWWMWVASRHKDKEEQPVKISGYIKRNKYTKNNVLNVNQVDKNIQGLEEGEYDLTLTKKE